MSDDPDTEARVSTPAPDSAGAPDRNATDIWGDLSASAAAPDSRGGPARETQERDAARRRGEARVEARSKGETPPRHLAPPVIRAAERTFQALADNVRDYAVFLLDPDGIITYWGEGARLMKWWTEDQAVGAHLRLLYLDGGSEDGTAEDHLIKAARTGESVSEGQRVRSDLSTFWAGVTLTALRDNDGTLLGFAKVTRDLTARRAADAALMTAAEAERALAAAEAVSAAKTQFAATVSHEIRTPINAVLGYTEMLASEKKGPLTAEQRRYIERLRTSAQHLLSVVSDVLELSRIDADPAHVERAVGQVDDVGVAALTIVEPQALERGVELIDDMKSQAKGLSYWGDEARVRQILVNLLANAVKFAAPRDGSPARVTLSAGASSQPGPDIELPGEGPWVWIRVEDTGPGIPEEQLEAIFEPFVQVDRRQNRAGGAGLGLTISRRLARRMGGEISVQSTAGVGSAFVVWLPVAPLESLRTGGAA
jgi:PAS domain S-box-containing protein